MALIREICLDTETTGLNPLEGDRLLEVGCVELVNGKKTGCHFHYLLNPDREIPEEVINIHGITNALVANQPKFSAIAQELLDFLDNSTLVAHNASFDIKFLNFELEKAGYTSLENEIIDSLILAKNKFPGQKNSLDNLCRRYNIDNSKRTFHGALLDAELLADIYIELNGGTQKSFLDDNAFTHSPVGIRELLCRIALRKVIPTRDFSASTEELQKHDEFLKKYVKNSLWYQS
jgi:DNA polymerase-3 subunit epsilon